MRKLELLFACALIAGGVAGCVGTESEDDLGSNPFLDEGEDGKEDTFYVNARGTECEVTLEADVEADGWRMFDAPAELAQFAVTFLRERREIYIEIIAEHDDVASTVQWLVNGEWVSREQAQAAGVQNLRRFRIPNVNVVFFDEDAENLQVGSVFNATVPVRPYTLMQDAGNTCAMPDGHITLDQSVYWYLWDPTHSGCRATTQQMTLTVEEVFPRNQESYPEYDRLLEDNLLSVVVIWAKLDDGDVTKDYNWRNVNGLITFLTQAGFAEVQAGQVGRRFERVRGTLTEQIDVMGPDTFYSVADYAHMDNWQWAVSNHEVVMYNGHSVLGTGMAFEQVQYPDFYQIFEIGSCLSYEYYVDPVLDGKGGWENVDILSNTLPTYYSENLPLVSTMLARLFYGAENGGRASWQDIGEAIARKLGHPHFGVSGARGNCFSPEGDRCSEPPPPAPDTVRVENTTAVDVPDNTEAGVNSTVEVTGGPTVGTASIELDLSHTYVGDLVVTVTHNGVSHVVWNRQGGSADNLQGTFELPPFAGTDSNGTWTVNVQDRARVDTGRLNRWTLVIAPAQ